MNLPVVEARALMLRLENELLPIVDDVMRRRADAGTQWPHESGAYVKEVRHRWR